MDVRLLKQFAAVYEEQNISRAAELSFVSQPALSNAIRQLEDELGCLLFNRSKRGVIPTSEAEQLYPMALKMIGDLNRIPALFKNQEKQELLNLNIMPELPQQHAVQILEQINHLIGNTRLNLTNDNRYDARITLEALKDDDESFLPLWRENYVFCLHKDHPLTEKSCIELPDLDNTPFIICPPCEGHHRTLGQLSQQQFRVNIVASTDSKHQVAMLLMANIGVSFLPEGMAKECPDIVTRPFAEGPVDYRQVGLAWPSQKLPSPHLQKLIQGLKAI